MSVPVINVQWKQQTKSSHRPDDIVVPTFYVWKMSTKTLKEDELENDDPSSRHGLYISFQWWREAKGDDFFELIPPAKS